MKQGTLITKIVMYVLFAGVLLYLAVYTVRGLSDPCVTTLVYQDVLDDAVKVTGVLVRQESALPGGAAIMDVLPEEGERVSAGGTVAILYQNSDALERKKQLQALELEREQLQYALSSGGNTADAARLERQIVDSILTLRSAGGDLSSLESNALSLRTQVLQREFAYSSSGDSVTALTETISSLDLQIAALEAQATFDTTAIYAPCSGIFSGLADGLESTLTPGLLEDISAGELAAFSKGTSSSGEGSVGKLITGDRWYFAAVVEPSTASRLQPGDQITVAFSRDYTGEVAMQVERVGKPEGEGCVLVLSSTRHLKDITLLRTQTVSLIFHRYTGLRLPKQALRIDTQIVTDPDTGTEEQVQNVGVYTLVGGQAKFKKVTIVREGGDHYLVAPADSLDTHRLRAGDEVIVHASGLYDGKVVLK